MTNGATTQTDDQDGVGMPQRAHLGRPLARPPERPAGLRLDPRGHAVLPKSPAGFTRSTMAMITNTTVLDASG